MAIGSGVSGVSGAASVQLIPLRVAHLCVNCNRVGDRADCCAGCGSKSLMNLAMVLNREGGEK